MVFLAVIIISLTIAFILGLTISEDTTSKRNNKPRKRSVWDDDPFFGTPLQKID